MVNEDASGLGPSSRLEQTAVRTVRRSLAGDHGIHLDDVSCGGNQLQPRPWGAWMGAGVSRETYRPSPRSKTLVWANSSDMAEARALLTAQRHLLWHTARHPSGVRSDARSV